GVVFMRRDDQMVAVIGVDHRRIYVLPSTRSRPDQVVRPAHSTIKRPPEAIAAATYASRIQDWRSARTARRNRDAACPVGPSATTASIDRPTPRLTVVRRLPDALAIKVRVQIRRPRWVRHYADRPKVATAQRVRQVRIRRAHIDPLPRLAIWCRRHRHILHE